MDLTIIEDNGGNLFLGEQGNWRDVTEVQYDLYPTSITPDVWREIQTWANQSRSRPAGTQVCRVMYKSGVVEVRDLIGPGNMGIAARRMMGYK